MLTLIAAMCMATPDLHESLSGIHEAPITALMQGDGTLLEVWGNEDSGSWTVIITRPDGLSCVNAAGEGFVVAVPVVDGEPI